MESPEEQTCEHDPGIELWEQFMKFKMYPMYRVCRHIAYMHTRLHQIEDGYGIPVGTIEASRAVLGSLSDDNVVRMVGFVYEKGSLDHQFLGDITGDYNQVVSAKYPYWNRTYGADHFMLSCMTGHEEDPSFTFFVLNSNPQGTVRYNRPTCVQEFDQSSVEMPTPPKVSSQQRDVPLPEFNMGHKLPVAVVDPSPLSTKTMLAFFLPEATTLQRMERQGPTGSNLNTYQKA
ncbi:hypothetical protein EJ110_NYTH25075 [Nymphaea thermarum]|nr:hypothetical protein EJ110_NYTH25075 [Nymphaea thermarum]